MSEEDAVRKFIDSSGFPLEFEAAAKLREAGFDPHHGRTFEDTNAVGSVVYREIDVLADLQDTRVAKPVQVVVECKHSPVPWVVLGGERDDSPQVMAITASLGYVDHSDAARMVRDALEIAPPLDFAVVSVKEAAKGQATDPAFDAVRQLLSAARGAARVADEGGQDLIVFPILVVDGSLWRYRDGEAIERIDRARLVWWGAPGPDATVVDIVTRAAFGDQYLLELRERLVILSSNLRGLPVRPAISFA